MLQAVQAFDRTPITETETAFERKLQAAESAFRAHDGWP
jgi:hypothetical protein